MAQKGVLGWVRGDTGQGQRGTEPEAAGMGPGERGWEGGRKGGHTQVAGCHGGRSQGSQEAGGPEADLHTLGSCLGQTSFGGFSENLYPSSEPMNWTSLKHGLNPNSSLEPDPDPPQGATLPRGSPVARSWWWLFPCQGERLFRRPPSTRGQPQEEVRGLHGARAPL